MALFNFSTGVLEALHKKSPVVALESAVISFGLPDPHNFSIAIECEDSVREHGATPATIAIMNGIITVGLEHDELRALASDEACIKTNLSNLAVVTEGKKTGATTVASTLAIAESAGIKVFSTGGIGGIHPNYASHLDISSDLNALAKYPLLVVCAGAKSLLDITATREALETLGIPVIGYRTNHLPGFYCADSGCSVDATAHTPEEIVGIANEHWTFGFNTAVLVCQPVPDEYALSPDILLPALDKAEQHAAEREVTERERTPYILRQLANLTEGATLEANLALLRNNASLAATLATMLHKS